MNGRDKGIIVAIFASSMWGFFGLFTRNLSEHGLSVYEISFVRASITAVVLGICLLILDRDSLRVKKEHLLLIILLGVTKMISDVCQVNAQLNIPLALNSVIQLTYPYFVLIFAFILFKEKLTKKKIIAAVLGFTGCVLVTNLSFDGEMKLIGIVLALASSIVTAINVIDVKACVDRDYSPAAIVFFMFSICAICNLPLCNLGDISNAVSADPSVIWWMLGIGLLMTLIPHTIDNWAMTKVEASIVAILGIMEAVMAAVVGVIFYNETLGILGIAGICLAFIAIILANSDSKDNTDSTT